MQRTSTQASAANFYISRFYHIALRCGLDANQMLNAAGIPRTTIDSPTKRIEVEKLGAFIIAICDALQDESMSLSKHPVPRGSFYMMGKLTIHEPSLEKAIRQIIRFFNIVSRSFSVNLDTKGNKALLTFDLLNPEMDEDHLFAEMNLMMLHRYSSWLIGENIPMIEVHFSYPPPVQVKEYSFLFPGRHVFNAASMGFSFSKKYLEHENVQNTGTMKSFMSRCPVELFSQPKTDFSLTSEVHLLLFKHINEESFTLEDVANYLLLTKRTLIRNLNEEGSSFQQIKDDVRRDRAIYYLTGNTLSVSEIAGKIGFSDPSVFTRAFKGWTGLTPSAYRASYSGK